MRNLIITTYKFDRSELKNKKRIDIKYDPSYGPLTLIPSYSPLTLIPSFYNFEEDLNHNMLVGRIRFHIEEGTGIIFLNSLKYESFIKSIFNLVIQKEDRMYKLADSEIPSPDLEKLLKDYFKINSKVSSKKVQFY